MLGAVLPVPGDSETGTPAPLGATKISGYRVNFFYNEKSRKTFIMRATRYGERSADLNPTEPPRQAWYVNVNP